MSLKICTYIIKNKNVNQNTYVETEVDLNDKNIIGNLVSIRDKGTNFVPKSERMINIITLMYLCIENPNLGNEDDNKTVENLYTIFTCIKENIFEIIKKYISDFNYPDHQNLLLKPMGIHELSWFLFNEFYKNDYRDIGFPNNCFDEYTYQINIKNFLSKYKRNVFNFTYTSMDYWIAEKIYDDIISPPVSTSSSSSSDVAMNVENSNAGGSNKNKTIKHKRNKKNKTNRNKRNKRNKKNKTIRKKKKRKNKTIKYV